MPAPKAYFYFTGSGLTINFTNMSMGQINALSWDFGDGSTSSDEAPVHIYSEPGMYSVTLTSTNADGSDSFTLDINVLTSGVPGFRPIYFQVTDILPTDTGVSDTFIVEAIRKNQLWLSNLVEPNIEGDSIYDEANYSPLVNSLIAKMTTLDVLVRGANSYLASLGAGSSGYGSAQVKSITTGPTEVEWFEGSEQWGEIMKADGLFNSLKADACSLASRLFIQLPFCPPIEKPVIPIQVWPIPANPVSPDNQFTV